MSAADVLDAGLAVVESGPLASLTEARRLLTQVNTIDEAKDIRDRAEALRVYARQAAYGLEIQNECAELKLRAERRAGELLADMPKNRGAASATRSHRATTLADAGINKSQSSRWQQVAALPDETFEAYLADTRTAGAEVTTAAVLRLARGMAAPSTGVAARRAPPAAAPVVTAAAWTRGRSPGSVEADRLRVAAMVEARRRLIDLHRAEYERYLAEARDRLGLGPVVEYQRRRAS